MKIFPPLTLRASLVALVIACIAPMVLFAGALILFVYQKQQAAIERGMTDTARAISAALDREFSGSIQALKVLASSKTLANDRLPEFYEEMKGALAAYGSAWQNMTLTDPAGQQLINLRLPFGSSLPRLNPELIKHNLQTGEAIISNLFSGPVTSAPSVVVSVPVFKNGQIKYLLRAGYSIARLSALLSQQDLPKDWVATIIDQNHIIAARTQNLEKYLGKPKSAILSAQARQHREAVRRGTTLDGVEAIYSLHRSELSGWTVALAMPAAVVDAPVRNLLMLAGAVGFAMLGVSLFFAGIIGRRVTRAANHLADGAQALGRGEHPRLVTSPIVELNVVAREIGDAAAKREQAELEVRRLHEELQQHAADLERRVAERTADLEAAKIQAEAADRIKSAFLATMSHELRTPLNHIIGFTGVLLQKLPGPLNDEQEKQLGIIRDSSRHLLALISDVLDISKVEAGELKLAHERFDLHALLKRLGAAFTEEAARRGLALELDIGDKVSIVKGDTRRVEQVLNNLLSNALKFTPRGTITLALEQKGDSFVITVTDTGLGIKSEDMDKLFRPFSRIDAGYSGFREGAGLGLAISMYLAQAMGGQMGAESEWGKGSRFTFTLPAGSSA